MSGCGCNGRSSSVGGNKQPTDLNTFFRKTGQSGNVGTRSINTINDKPTSSSRVITPRRNVRSTPSAVVPRSRVVSFAAAPADTTDEIIDGQLYFINNQFFVVQYTDDSSCGSCPSTAANCKCLVFGPCGASGTKKSLGTLVEATNGNLYVQMEIVVLQRSTPTSNVFTEMPGASLSVGQFFAVSFVEPVSNTRYYWQAGSSNENLVLGTGTPFDGTADARYRVFVLIDIGIDLVGIYRGTEDINEFASLDSSYWIQSVGRYDDKKQYYLVKGEGDVSSGDCTASIHQKTNLSKSQLGPDDDPLGNVSYPMTFININPPHQLDPGPGASVALPTGMQWWQWMFVAVGVYALFVVGIIIILIVMKVV